MEASILSLGTAVPPFKFYQIEMGQKMVDIFSGNDEKLKTLYKNSSIATRYSVLEDFAKEREEWNFWGREFPKEPPGMAKRNDLYKVEAPKLSFQAANRALEKWGGDVGDISHIIFISCTGLVAPGIEFLLMQKLKLKSSVERLGINFMGCFGAFKGLAVAQAFAKENPENRVLVVCTELCSLHFQVEQTADNILANSLFSDGAAAVVVGVAKDEKPLYTLCNKASMGLENSLERMSWEASDTGFIMKLCHTVPVLLKRKTAAFVQGLIGENISYDACNFAIHPGGKSIVQAIEKALMLEEGSSVASWDTLKNFGNMSSATFLFVLERLLEEPKKRWTVGIGFGPGLSVEGILLK